MTTYYKIEDEENGNFRYIREDDEKTVIISFGAIEPKCEKIDTKYKRQPGEVIRPCTRREYLEKHFEFLDSNKNVLASII